MAYTVYCHENKINGKKYFGITKDEPKRRWSGGHGYKRSRYFNYAIQKYGWENFDHKIVKDGLTKDEAFDLEKELIEKYKTTDDRFGYNISEGGQSGAAGVCQSEETREKRRTSMLGRKQSEETRRKMSEAAKGRTFSEETRKRMSEAAKDAKKKVYCVETKIVYNGIREAAKETGLFATNICAVCKGKHKHTKGYHFYYV